MTTKIFENIIENNFGVNASSKAQNYTQKSDSCEFRNLVKNQIAQSKPNDCKLEQKNIKANEYKQVSETKDTNRDIAKTNADCSSVTKSSKTTISSIIEKDLSFEEAAAILETKDDIIQEESPIIEDQEPETIVLDTRLTEEHDKNAEFIDSTDNIDNKDNFVAPVSKFDSDQLKTLKNINDEGKTTSINTESSVIAKLSDQDQTTRQGLKIFELSNSFTSHDIAKGTELLTNKLQTSLEPKGISELEALSTRLEAPIKLTIENESKKNAISEPKPIFITPSLNLALAETTKHGKEVISRMQGIPPTGEQDLVSNLELGDFLLDNKAPLSNFSDKNNSNAEQKKSLLLENFEAAMEQTKDGIFEITFEGNNNNLKRSETPKLPMQVSLAIKEVLNLNSDSGKKQITINLHPHSLGAVKVEILSQIGQDGVSKIESIKISADKHDTLVMLEERRADLSKSLKEVNGAQEKEASLQFEMSQDQGKRQEAYFSSMEERDNWMSKFSGLISDIPVNEKQELIIDEYATRGIVTEDKIDLIA